jgi:hypothetical protein
MTSPHAETDSRAPDPALQPPPVLGSWRRLYWLLVVELALITLASYALMRWAS